MGGVDIDLSNERLDAIGNKIQRFLRVGVLLGLILAMAGWLMLVFITIAPPITSAVKTVDPIDRNFDAELVPVEGGARGQVDGTPVEEDDKEAAWLTEFEVVKKGSKVECTEKSTGIEAKCDYQAGLFTVSMPPSGSGDWPTWLCQSCLTSCLDCSFPGGDSNCTEAVRDAQCRCLPGCSCDKRVNGNLYYCYSYKAQDYPMPKTGALSGEFQFFAVISDVAYLFFTLGLLLSELDIQKFTHYFTFLNQWIPKAFFHLFIGAQLINTTSALDQAGAKVKVFIHFIALSGGWLMVFCALVQVWFRVLYARPLRPCKLCGLFCILATLVCVIIGALLGTTADTDDGSGSS